MRKHSISIALALLALAGGGAYAALPPDPVTTCTIGGTISGTVTLVYFGATAPNATIRKTAAGLYGTPLSDCGADQQTFRGNVDTNNDGVRDTCVTLFVGSHSGSCEGIEALDRSLDNFNVCPDTPGASSTVLLSSLGLHDNVAASDVGAGPCGPLIGGFTRPQLFSGPTSTENRLFAIPFAFIANKNLRPLLSPSRVIAPGVACPAGLSDCPRIDVSLSKDKLKGIFGNNDECDWRYMDPSIHDAGLGTPVIGAVMRNRLSGTRNNFNATILENLGASSASIFVPGTGDVINRVKSNTWCGNDNAECGESGPVIGGQHSVCESIPSPNVVDLGYIGTDRLAIVDPGTPLNPFDDYGVRGVDTDNYDVLSYQGRPFNKAGVQCGTYEYWSFERMYYDPNYFTPGARRNALTSFITQLQTDAVSDTTVVALGQMQVSRANDGSPTFPVKPYSPAICAAP
ncbi:MAG TPA: hypothetical protein VNL37_07435 [Candidatus Polarisedimenticolia bacterium]|nr:hypothetical protein [Candidatus Polarisedimenticolia bacterium]